jgi:hypothetical protein
MTECGLVSGQDYENLWRISEGNYQAGVEESGKRDVDAFSEVTEYLTECRLKKNEAIKQHLIDRIFENRSDVLFAIAKAHKGFINSLIPPDIHEKNPQIKTGNPTAWPTKL